MALFSARATSPDRGGASGDARLDDCVLPERGDVLGGVAELAKDLVGMLTVRGRRAANRAGRARERRREPLHQHLAALRMAHRLGHTEVLDLLVLEYFPHVQDRSRRYPGAIERFDPFGARLFR